ISAAVGKCSGNRRSASVRLCVEGYAPVNIEACEGTVHWAGESARSNTAACDAKSSSAGDVLRRWPYRESRSRRVVSSTTNKRFSCSGIRVIYVGQAAESVLQAYHWSESLTMRRLVPGGPSPPNPLSLTSWGEGETEAHRRGSANASAQHDKD